MDQIFICNQAEVEYKLQTLKQIGASEDGCTKYFIDISSNEEWTLTQYESEYNGKSITVLKNYPELSTNQLINIAFSSADKNTIIGSSRELLENEIYKEIDFREKLIERLSLIDVSKLTDFEKERIKIIIYESGLYDQTNRKEIVGKHFTEIDKDANYYLTISIKAKNILNAIQKYSS